jgi:hypothetical protein
MVNKMGMKIKKKEKEIKKIKIKSDFILKFI